MVVNFHTTLQEVGKIINQELLKFRTSKNNLKPMIGIKNPDGFNGVHVSLQVVAVVSEIN